MDCRGFGGFETETEEVRSLTQRTRNYNYMGLNGYPGLYGGNFMTGYPGGYFGGFPGGYGPVASPLNPRVYTDPAPMGCCGIGGLYGR
uniref:Spore coat protein n=1 Tax=Ascaris lumbricoides TaxID=6252 RepID=A0A0M3IV85_ASCLU